MFEFSRRRFLATSAAASVLGSAGAWNPGAFGAASRAPIKLGIQLYSLRGFSVEKALKVSSELGFEQVEFYGGMLPIDSSEEQIEQIRAEVAKLGMSISAHGVNHFGKDSRANRRIFEFAKKLGIPQISADPDPESFENLNELVQEFDVRIAIHNHGPTHRYNRVTDVLQAIEKWDVRIGACADLGHYIRSGEDAPNVIRALRGRLYGIHLKDFAEKKDVTKGVILGQGHLDVPAVVAALYEVNFPENGAFSLEYEENPQDPIQDIRLCVDVARNALAKVRP